MDIKAFQKLAWDYYAEHRRPMPWRDKHDPYSVVVSEIMLQQTQVSRVLVKFTEFTAEFPDFATLAAASPAAVIARWQGLGYNRRALNLHKLAKTVVEEYGGELPADPAELVKLPGIGSATAGSIAAFAFNAPVIFIETNIRRVFIHHFFDRTEPSSTLSDAPVRVQRSSTTSHLRASHLPRPEETLSNLNASEVKVSDNDILPLVEAALDHSNPREWYYALMDYGTHLAKTVPNPNRRSKHHSVQSKFEGSDRQLRGAILRALIVAPTDIKSLLEYTKCSDEVRLHKILHGLVHDGLIVAQNSEYRLP